MKTERFSASVARSGGEIGQQVIEIGGRWVCRTFDGTGRTLSVNWGDDVRGEVGVGDPHDALVWLAEVLS